MSSKTKKVVSIILLCFILLILESIIKYILINKIPLQGFYLIPKILQITYIPNYNLAFNLPLPNWLIVVFAIVALIFLSFIWWINFLSGNLKLILATSLIIVGAVSNLLDRLVMGYVIDYINIFIWPVFNLADCMIVTGIIIYVVKELKTSKQTYRM